MTWNGARGLRLLRGRSSSGTRRRRKASQQQHLRPSRAGAAQAARAAAPLHDARPAPLWGQLSLPPAPPSAPPRLALRPSPSLPSSHVRTKAVLCAASMRRDTCHVPRAGTPGAGTTQGTERRWGYLLHCKDVLVTDAANCFNDGLRNGGRSDGTAEAPREARGLDKSFYPLCFFI